MTPGQPERPATTGSTAARQAGQRASPSLSSLAPAARPPR